MSGETAGPGAAPGEVPGRPTAMAAVVSVPIKAWRVFSTRMPSRCRFYPSCSAYALEALQRHGAARGSWLAARRIGRCHPWNPGGLDPVPQELAPRRQTRARPRATNIRSPHSPDRPSAETA